MPKKLRWQDASEFHMYKCYTDRHVQYVTKDGQTRTYLKWRCPFCHTIEEYDEPTLYVKEIHDVFSFVEDSFICDKCGAEVFVRSNLTAD